MDTTALDAAIAALTAEVAATETIDGSVEAILANFAKATAQAVSVAVAEATAQQGAADQTVVDAAVKAVNDVTTRFTAAAGGIGAAINTTPVLPDPPVTPPAPPTPPAQPVD